MSGHIHPSKTPFALFQLFFFFSLIPVEHFPKCNLQGVSDEERYLSPSSLCNPSRHQMKQEVAQGVLAHLSPFQCGSCLPSQHRLTWQGELGAPHKALPSLPQL